MNRRTTVMDVQNQYPVMHGVFGRWVRQFRRHEFGVVLKAVSSRRVAPAAATGAGMRSPEPVRDVCVVTGKRVYSSNGATKALLHALKSGRGHVPRRKYLCDHCKRYHLSSRLF